MRQNNETLEDSRLRPHAQLTEGCQSAGGKAERDELKLRPSLLTDILGRKPRRTPHNTLLSENVTSSTKPEVYT